MAMRKLESLQRQADELTNEEQILLAQYLLAKVSRKKVGEEVLLTEPLLSVDWMRPEEDKAWANL